MFGEIADGKMELNRYGRIVSANWLNLPKHRHPHVELSAFAVMPNHIHGIVVINRIESGLELPKPLLLSEIVRGFKTFSARGINMSMANADAPVWQRNYWEHVIRNQEAFNRIHEYIVANPRRWHLDRENPERIGGDEFDIWINGL